MSTRENIRLIASTPLVAKIDTDIILNLLPAFMDESYSFSYSQFEN